MSIVDSRHVKLDLPRSGLDPFWAAIEAEFKDDSLAWKYLAMLALRENAGWPLHDIGKAFGHPKGHVTRCLRKIKQRIAERFNRTDLEGSEIEWRDD